MELAGLLATRPLPPHAGCLIDAGRLIQAGRLSRVGRLIQAGCLIDAVCPAPSWPDATPGSTRPRFPGPGDAPGRRTRPLHAHITPARAAWGQVPGPIPSRLGPTVRQALPRLACGQEGGQHGQEGGQHDQGNEGDPDTGHPSRSRDGEFD